MYILKDESLDKEVRISAIKYFSKIHYNHAKIEIKNLLNHKVWEYRAISASTLGKYKENDVIESLLDSITDYNWYVRYNSAISLLSFNESNIIDRVIEKNDKYSIDILFYAMLNKGKISYEDYLEKTGKLEVNHA
ncbi:HEAT repeat domain-containing protein [Romboutsia ilealis]|uniref:HEAT repeat domain-containing protein n=1 Tax=Romboutsia ilealis TaxID=1115758 RepID=UPI0025A5E1FE|nr:HEAT repeat domain-containing protein [Romboutsia ilealis]